MSATYSVVPILPKRLREVKKFDRPARARAFLAKSRGKKFLVYRNGLKLKGLAEA
jgi:hypothetical protein